ncbi:MAG: HhH-GPD family protein [Acidimicrobiales bacterium]
MVSEVMAQQTQVARVVPAYERFLGELPTPTACATAPLGRVLQLWSGLGYNRRARGLHRAATAMVDHHGGQVPSTLDALLALPGVGEYTARAVLAFAFGHDVGVVDTNAGRVLSRAVSGTPLERREAQSLVDAMVPPGMGWTFGQALLDLGAEVCVAGRPRCERCPIRPACAWSEAGGADPSMGSAGTSSAQGKFQGSDRQGRGRLIDALRVGEITDEAAPATVGWPDDPDRARRVISALVDEGLVVRHGDGVLGLPF